MKFGSSALTKAIALIVLALLMLAPMSMLRELINERATLREQAVASVSRGWGGKQIVSGPVLAVPVTMPSEDNRVVQRDWFVLPDTLTVESTLGVERERRKLGVYEVPVYLAKVHAVATFNIAARIAALSREQRSVTVHLDRARLLVPVSDGRGVRSVRLAGDAFANALFEPDATFPIGTLAVSLPADAALDQGSRSYTLDLEVAGTESLSFLPLARATTVKLAGNWAHPGFAQGFLPTERNVDKDRFTASWRVLDLNRAYGSHWFQGSVAPEALQASAFGVNLVQPVDLYQRAERSVKYGGLFIALTLMTLFLWEHLSRKRLHPFQYGLVALALSVFYLLLLALAEHIGFAYAYALASVALCSLLGIYLAGVFNRTVAGAGSAGAFAGVYGLLYLLITSEDYSLLAGALGLFGVLAIVMFVTRRVDWYRVGAKSDEEDGLESPR